MSDLQDRARIRNFGIIAHIDAGKTTVSERILYYTHKIFRMGEVHDGNSTMDFMPEEQERGITITAASTFCEWKEHELNFIDTPGHVDFTIEVERSLRVLDGAVGVFCAVNGVEPQSETVWRQSEALKVPKLAFINKMDKIGADFEMVLASMEEKLSTNPLLIQIPLFKDETFYAIADLIREKRLEFDEEDEGETIIETNLSMHTTNTSNQPNSDFDTEEKALTAIWREKMLETLADKDEYFLDLYIAENYTEQDIYDAMRRVCISRKAVPTLVGAARKNKGIQPLLNAICEYLPSPLNQDNDKKIKLSLAEKNLKALVFKIFFEKHTKIALLRLYNGSFHMGKNIFNLNQKEEINIKQMYRLHADFQEEIDSAHLGDIVAIAGIENIKTGDTIVANRDFNTSNQNLDFESELLESLSEYNPVISLAFEAQNEAEACILQEALTRYTLEDPTLILQGEDFGQYIVSGMGELHLEILKERIIREYHITPRTGNPEVVLCQTIETAPYYSGNTDKTKIQPNETNIQIEDDLASPIRAHVEFEKEIDNTLEYANITLSLSSCERSTGNHVNFTQSVVESLHKQALAINDTFLHDTSTNFPALLQSRIKKSAETSLLSGSSSGHILVDIQVNIESIEIKEHSTKQAFYIATHVAIKEALDRAQKENKIVLLEPIMHLEILVPDENLSSCINLINTSSGTIEKIDEKTGLKYLIASAPMHELFGFATRLRSVSQGRANLVMRFRHYQKR